MSRQAIEAFIRDHADHLKHQDINSILDNFSDASLFWEAGGSTLKGKDEIRCWFQAMFDNYHVSNIHYDIIALRYTEKLASCAAIWNISGLHDDEGDPTAGKRVRVTYNLEKTTQGWKLWHVHGSQW